MSDTLLIKCAPGDPLVHATFYRAIFDTVLPKQLVVNIDGIAQHQWEDLQALNFVAPINPPEAIAGSTVMVFDLVTVASSTPRTVADLVAALDHSKISTFLRSLERVTKADVYDDAGVASRAAAAAAAQAKSDSESLAEKISAVLGKAGVVLVLLLIVIVALVGMKAYRELA